MAKHGAWVAQGWAGSQWRRNQDGKHVPVEQVCSAATESLIMTFGFLFKCLLAVIS
jgi:hypothetical protein